MAGLRLLSDGTVRGADDGLIRLPSVGIGGFPAGSRAASPVAHPSGIRILIVDDEALMREATADLLEELGFDVVGEASNGLSGLELATSLVPDVVLMDVRMPQMDGIDCTGRLHSIFPSMRIIMLSAYDDPSLRKAAMANGACSYVLKGGGARFLRDAILAACEGRGVRDEPEEGQGRVEPDRPPPRG